MEKGKQGRQGFREHLSNFTGFRLLNVCSTRLACRLGMPSGKGNTFGFCLSCLVCLAWSFIILATTQPGPAKEPEPLCARFEVRTWARKGHYLGCKLETASHPSGKQLWTADGNMLSARDAKHQQANGT